MIDPAHLRLLAASSFLVPMVAQTNSFAVHSPLTQFATRANFGSAAGEMLFEVQGQLVSGLGDVGPACQFHGFRVILQDIDAATPEPYAVVLRAPDPFGGPDRASTGRIARIAATTPRGQGQMAWQLTVSFAAPVANPCVGRYYYGVELGAAIPGVQDGVYTHIVTYAGEGARANAPNLSYGVSSVGSGPLAPAVAAKFGPLTTAPTCRAGVLAPLVFVGQPSFGISGLFPTIKNPAAGRDDGLLVAVEDRANSGGRAHVFAGDLHTVVTPIRGFGGNLYLAPRSLLYLGQVSLDITGSGLFTVVPQGGVPAAAIGSHITYQCVTHNAQATNLRFTNTAAQQL